jgi:2,3-bisphosphoglycerate-dependent phosphoglycerate mutase
MQCELHAELPEQFTVYLTRHASPDRSRIDLPYHIPPGPELTARGQSEAAELGAFLQREGVPLLQVSPLERTLRTATIASEVCGAVLEINPDIAEWRPEEDEQDVLERTQRVFLSAARYSQEHGVPVALVTHGGPVLALLHALGGPRESMSRCRIYDSRNPISPAGAWRIELDAGRLRMELVFAPHGYHLPALENRRFLLDIKEETPAFSSD